MNLRRTWERDSWVSEIAVIKVNPKESEIPKRDNVQKIFAERRKKTTDNL